MRVTPILFVALCVQLPGGMMQPIQAQSQATARAVFINRVQVPADTLTLYEQYFQVRVPDGRYWYDRISGGWGVEGGPTLGFTVANLQLGGPLPPDISRGGTGVFVNGRELHPADVIALQQLLGPIVPGRYWLDAEGYAGQEGGPPITNLRQVAAQLQQRGSGVNENHADGSAAFGNLNTGIGVITDGQGGGAVFSH